MTRIYQSALSNFADIFLIFIHARVWTFGHGRLRHHVVYHLHICHDAIVTEASSSKALSFIYHMVGNFVGADFHIFCQKARGVAGGGPIRTRPNQLHCSEHLHCCILLNTSRSMQTDDLLFY